MSAPTLTIIPGGAARPTGYRFRSAQSRRNHTLSGNIELMGSGPDNDPGLAYLDRYRAEHAEEDREWEAHLAKRPEMEAGVRRDAGYRRKATRAAWLASHLAILDDIFKPLPTHFVYPDHDAGVFYRPYKRLRHGRQIFVVDAEGRQLVDAYVAGDAELQSRITAAFHEILKAMGATEPARPSLGLVH